MKVKLFLAWYDLWIGIYFARKDRAVYICPLPCCVIKIWLKPVSTDDIVGFEAKIGGAESDWIRGYGKLKKKNAPIRFELEE